MLESPLGLLSRATTYSGSNLLPAILTVLVPIFCPIVLAQTQKSMGDYESLSARQKSIVSTYHTYLKETPAIASDPQSMYDGWAQSYRSTFQSVTNALEKTALTDRARGKPVSALDLIEAMEGVAGEARGKRWDEQFRLYVTLRPDALRIMSHSLQLHKQPDNIFYHAGYPLSFRTNGQPFLELSLTPDGKRAEIAINFPTGVGFPGELLDSRLAAANFDVRAGRNYVLYSTRWSGLDSWWKSLTGTPDVAASASKLAPGSSVDFPASTPAETRNLSDAVEEFLRTWLVNQQPNVALSYFENEALACVDGPANATANNRRMRLYSEMQLTNGVIGKIDSTSQAVLVAPSRDSSMPNYDGLPVPESDLPFVLCAGTLEGASKDVYNVSFRLEGPRNGEALIQQYWRKAGSSWKIAAYRVEHETDGTAPPPPKFPEVNGDAQPQTIPGDPEMITSAIQFMNDWFLLQNINGAVAFLAPSADQCFPRGTGREKIMAAFQTVTKGVESRDSLQALMQPVAPWSGQFPIVEHLYSSAFTILQPTSGLLASLRCTPSTRRSQAAYVTSFALRTTSGEGTGIAFIWEPVDGEWQITSWALLDR